MPRYTEEQIEQSRRRSALCVSIAVMLYILCVIPVILWEEYGVIAMFAMVAVATGLLIYNNMTKLGYKKSDDSMVEEFKEWQDQSSDQKKLYKAIKGAITSLVIVIYIVVSFTTHAWHITWVIFLIGAAIENIVKALFELKQS